MVFDPPADKAGRDTSHLPDPPEASTTYDFIDPEESKEEEHEMVHDPDNEHHAYENKEYKEEAQEENETHGDDEHAPEGEPFCMALDSPNPGDHDDNQPLGDEPESHPNEDEHDPDDEHHFSKVLDGGPIETVPPDEPVDDETEDGDVERFRPSVYCAPGYEGDEEDPPPEAAQYDGPPSTSRVYVNVYDLSITNSLCCHWIGCGQYHTGVVVFGTEHHFNPVGVEDYTPRNVINARWRTAIDRGTFTGTPGDVSSIIKDLRKEYRRNKYNMIFRNANHFSDDLLERLNGSELPRWLNRVSNCATSCCKCCIPTSVKKNVKAKDWIKHDPHKVQGIYGSNIIAR